MKVLLASRSPNPHDQRFLEAWRSVNVEVDLVHTADLKPAALGERVLEASPDVIQAGPLSDVAPSIAAVWDGPLIAVSWGFDLMNEVKDSTVRRRIADVLIRADHVLVDNNAPLRVAVELGAPRTHITSMPWGVELDRFHPGSSALRSRLGWTDEEFVLLSTRHHHPIYDVETTARGFAAAASRLPQLRGIFCGSGPRTSDVRRILEADGVLQRCVFLGAQAASDLPDIYRAANLYVSSSHVDGTSVSLLEAMASGVPVCVSAIEGNTEWVADGRGESFKIGASKELAMKVVQMAEDPKRTRELAVAARNHVRARADWSKAGRRLLSISDAAIGNRGR